MVFSKEEGFDIPILFLLFNRPDTTEQVFQAIRVIQPKRLYVGADGPRPSKNGEKLLCEKTREVIKKIDWKCEVRTLFRDSNLGCKEAVSGAINWFFEQEEWGVILEDDCLPHPTFFEYCRELLIKYKENEKVMLIGGQHFLSKNHVPNESYYFSQYPHIWGWASWRRAWKKYDKEMVLLDDFLKIKLNNSFISKAQRKHIERQLKLVKSGKLNTWDYQWLFSILNSDGYAVTPSKNLVINLGFRNQSTHTFLKDSKREVFQLESLNFPLVHPKNSRINYNADLITFNNVYSKNVFRIIRLIRENGLSSILKYALKQIKN